MDGGGLWLGVMPSVEEAGRVLQSSLAQGNSVSQTIPGQRRHAPHICPLTWANQLDLGEEKSSGVAHIAIDSQQSHNWPVERKGWGGGEWQLTVQSHSQVALLQ
ncbi:hypothetical protein EYF80_006709 [Liparis tanakae]|uniref:Uncharacterized protein n=1 Tax=Liparis tanakae TaxID=230148 RepID=A0A4Z2J0N8_9TELE|nr:hypothetical protein EYF80_006709 [Liparis tanakae]